MLPKYDEIMLPLLKILSDGKEKYFGDIIDLLSDIYKKDPNYQTTEEELNQLIPSGTMTVFKNRVGWAKTYLKQAKLIESSKRGMVKITELGMKIIKESPEKINKEYLLQFPGFQEFVKRTNSYPKNIDYKNEEYQKYSPDEQLEEVYKTINETLIQDLLDKIKNVNFKMFEKIVLDVLLKMGYGGDLEDAAKVIGRTGDEGIDGIIKQDPLGLDNVYIQAKRWTNTTVGRPEVQKFVGALNGKGATKGIFITSSQFSSDAFDYAKNLNNVKIILIDGRELAEKMLKHNVGVSSVRILEIKKIDSDYFED